MLIPIRDVHYSDHSTGNVLCVQHLQVLIHSPIRRAVTQSKTWKTQPETATLTRVYRPWGCSTLCQSHTLYRPRRAAINYEARLTCDIIAALRNHRARVLDGFRSYSSIQNSSHSFKKEDEAKVLASESQLNKGTNEPLPFQGGL